MVVGLLKLRRGHMPDGSEEAVVVEPPDPFPGGEFDVFDGAPRPVPADDFRLEEPDDRLGQGDVVDVAPAADRGCDACFGQAVRIADTEMRATSTPHKSGRLRTPSGVRR